MTILLLRSLLCFVVLALCGLGVDCLAADGAEPGIAWLDEAEARIEKHRNVDAVVTVVDADGDPVPGVQLEMNQSRHEFLFGCNFFMFDKFRSESDESVYREKFASLFNFATFSPSKADENNLHALRIRSVRRTAHSFLSTAEGRVPGTDLVKRL